MTKSIGAASQRPAPDAGVIAKELAHKFYDEIYGVDEWLDITRGQRDKIIAAMKTAIETIGIAHPTPAGSGGDVVERARKLRHAASNLRRLGDPDGAAIIEEAAGLLKGAEAEPGNDLIEECRIVAARLIEMATVAVRTNADTSAVAIALGNDIAKFIVSLKGADSGDAGKRDERMFPMQEGPEIPWRLLAPFEARAEKNHSQSLKRLAERGGLSVCEAIAIMNDEPWRETNARIGNLSNPDRTKEMLRFIAEREALALPASSGQVDADREGLKIIALHIRDWLKRNKEMRAKEFLATDGQTALMAIPCSKWPSHGQLENWITLLERTASVPAPVVDEDDFPDTGVSLRHGRRGIAPIAPVVDREAVIKRTAKELAEVVNGGVDLARRSGGQFSMDAEKLEAWLRPLALLPVGTGDAEAVRRKALEDAARIIRSGAGMCDLIDDELLDEQTRNILSLIELPLRDVIASCTLPEELYHARQDVPPADREGK